ncbi:glycosyltransferase family 1 protein [Oricola cellulosilytica]|uniref:Glycosyltransferase family 1 protein n=2 Tax=Oricola cellulosilytica TaxID=1429082 RepID=A0A4R0PEJ9_9HYPH|nr:glycosyltransferase family 1 protein [Oricola cellulosilytica]
MGGLFRHVRDLALAHEAAGHSVGIICDTPGVPGYSEGMVAELTPRISLGVKRVSMRREVGPRDLIDARKVLNVLKELKPSVLHGHGAKGGVYARALGSLIRAERSRVARFYSPHGGSLHYGAATRPGKAYFRVERFLERFTDHILFVADFEKRAYTAKIGPPACPWSVNRNGLTAAEFEPVEPVADAADFLFLGELRAIKGPDLFIHALAELKSAGHAHIRAVIVGDGAERQQLAGLAESLGLSDSVEFRPSMPAREAFALARTFVMPSRAEALPYVVIEALAAQVPVVATYVGGIPEIFGSSADALVAPESGALAAAMRAAAENRAHFMRLLPGQTTLKERFSIERMAEHALEAYREAVTKLAH